MVVGNMRALIVRRSGTSLFTFIFHFAAMAAVLVSLAGCSRMFEDHSRQALEAAEQKYTEGDYQGAVDRYEEALDGTPASAEVHFKLALLFDDKLKNPLGAMYHFQRYLDLQPNGPHAREAASSMKDDEIKLAATLSHGALMSQKDAADLKNANLELRKQIEELRASRSSASREAASQSGGGKSGDVAPAGSTTYVVLTGDTLASISRKFYKTSTRWKDIQEANASKLKGPSKLKPGMILIIPK